ncbi:MAG: DUF421 domain-containing protein [Acetobacteraceae bacterium]|nr:DUF421 domain-containing protein [Acetobacteraceae bacterium]MBV8522725.1 DUF421 domain-containing protein [Acetobacteraceae bacterium]MBV8591957.1 DUF421 domain-containing protein [Acetobacteraceae bacterium]
MLFLQDVFGTMHQVTWWQECARAALIFFYGLALVRLAGRRVFGKWSALDIIVSIIVGSNLSRALTGSAPLGGTLLATMLLMGLHWVLAHAASLSPRLSRVLEGGAIELAVGGDRRQSALVRAAVSEADLGEALRQQGIEGLAEAKRVTLEPSGKITVMKAK